MSSSNCVGGASQVKSPLLCSYTLAYSRKSACPASQISASTFRSASVLFADRSITVCQIRVHFTGKKARQHITMEFIAEPQRRTVPGFVDRVYLQSRQDSASVIQYNADNPAKFVGRHKSSPSRCSRRIEKLSLVLLFVHLAFFVGLHQSSSSQLFHLRSATIRICTHPLPYDGGLPG